ncbi:MAG: MoxR family ATPase [SAR202 cluster bacterium]|nr:MoxR family ATPase [SAR202 cluster bacterium]|tara:strand:+ start:53849 stop:54799 length:951 start_codon:yes stop_codon:yes gene_type:complete
MSEILIVSKIAKNIRENIQKIIVGKDDQINTAIIAMLCRGHVLIDDVPGTGKTSLSKALADSLDCSFNRVQFTPDLMPSDILGVNIFDQKKSTFKFIEGPIFSQILLADEINRATPRTQSAMLEAMQERRVTVDGNTRDLPDPFMVIATQNPIEMEGTFPLPESQIDRFMVRIQLGYPGHDEETQIYRRFMNESEVPDLKPVFDSKEINKAVNLIPTVRVDDFIVKYIVDLIHVTRQGSGIKVGGSPRAGLALYKTSQALAALEGRDYVIPDDVKKMAVPVLSHRLVLDSSAKLKGQTGENFVEIVLSKLEVPISK